MAVVLHLRAPVKPEPPLAHDFQKRHAAGGVFCDATNQELPKKLLRQTSLPARHHYGLQIAEGMVTFFESYERELERYWTKMLFLQLS
jgi:hypothetical protein